MDVSRRVALIVAADVGQRREAATQGLQHPKADPEVERLLCLCSCQDRVLLSMGIRLESAGLPRCMPD